MGLAAGRCRCRLTTFGFRAWVHYQTTGQRLKEPRRPPRRRGGPPRNERYKAWVRTLPSAVSGFEPPAGCEAAHTGSDGGARQKASDLSVIPLTIEEHREYHQHGRAAFERSHGIDCREVVRNLNAIWCSRGAR